MEKGFISIYKKRSKEEYGKKEKEYNGRTQLIIYD